jgi:acetyl esterase/lipase
MAEPLFHSTKLMPLAVFAIEALLIVAPAAAASKIAPDRSPATGNYNIPLWESGKVPLAKGDGPLDSPFLTVFLPAEGKRNGGSVVVAPGGSNIMLMYGAEGTDIAERYNDWGVTAFVLTYRLSPRYGEDARVLDGKRAIQLVRSRAAEFKLDPKRVGYIGFSAGSNLGRSVVDAAGPGDANASDPVDRLSSRPDYLGLVYGPGRDPRAPGRGPGRASASSSAPVESLKDFPPTFLMCAAGDAGNANGSAQLFIDLNKAGAVAEIHVYQKGHHGFGDGFASGTYADWMGRLEHFLKQGGFIPGGKE